jgi:peptide/nickel transport system permease protein
VIVYPSIWWNFTISIQYVKINVDPLKNLGNFILPAVVLGMGMAGVTMRMMRTMMLEVLRQDYVRTAWAKGLRERVVVMRHALKNALIPVITIIGMQVSFLIGGDVIIEQIFNLPGLGRLLVTATQQRDYPIVQGVLLFFALAMVLINLLVDLTYGFFDPRVSYK